MAFNIFETGTSYCLIISLYRPFNFHSDDFNSSLTYPCSRSLLKSRVAFRKKTSIWRRSLVISYKLRDKDGPYAGEDGIVLLRNGQYVTLTVKWVFYFQDINECASKPCKNGGKCKDGVNKYTCTCAEGYTGTSCQTGMCTKINLCNKISSRTTLLLEMFNFITCALQIEAKLN